MKDKKNNLFVKLSVYVDTADDETYPQKTYTVVLLGEIIAIILIIAIIEISGIIAIIAIIAFLL